MKRELAKISNYFNWLSEDAKMGGAKKKTGCKLNLRPVTLDGVEPLWFCQFSKSEVFIPYFFIRC